MESKTIFLYQLYYWFNCYQCFGFHFLRAFSIYVALIWILGHCVLKRISPDSIQFGKLWFIHVICLHWYGQSYWGYHGLVGEILRPFLHVTLFVGEIYWSLFWSFIWTVSFHPCHFYVLCKEYHNESVKFNLLRFDAEDVYVLAKSGFLWYR